jgi:uncharacterized protein YdbL (DUF1318 family)
MTFENMTRRGFLATVAGAALALLSFNALAQSAEDLRATGAAGERWDGYLEARDSSASAAVEKINAERRKVYQQRAGQQGVSAEDVGKVYAKQIFTKLPSGSWFKQANGSWVQK